MLCCHSHGFPWKRRYAAISGKKCFLASFTISTFRHILLAAPSIIYLNPCITKSLVIFFCLPTTTPPASLRFHGYFFPGHARSA
uniref:Uncharacterized protein n=1 Tax=Anguilla anguilla TaxID=7936 RepID=A0A0E9WDR2_ANGAN